MKDYIYVYDNNSTKKKKEVVFLLSINKQQYIVYKDVPNTDKGLYVAKFNYIKRIN